MIKVLVVEDEPPILRAVKSLIEQTNPAFAVMATATDGALAMELMEKEPFDVVFTDIRMPVMDGLALLDYINNCHPSVLSVVLSGFTEFEYARQALKSRAFDYLLKPISQETLATLLDKLEAALSLRMRTEKRKQLSRTINKSADESKAETPGDDGKLYAVMLLCAGPFLYFDGDYLAPGVAFWEETDINAIVAAALREPAGFWTFQGETQADRIVVTELAQNQDAQAVIQEIYEGVIHAGALPITAVGMCSPVGFRAINKAYKTLRVRLLSAVRIGRSSITWSDGCRDHRHTGADPVRQELAGKITTALQSGDGKAIDENLRSALSSLEHWDCSQQDVAGFFETVLALFAKDRFNTAPTALQEWHRDMIEAISGSMTMDMLHGNVLSVLVEMCGKAQQGHAQGSRRPAIIGRVEKYLQDNYRQPITNLTLSQEFGFVPSYISRLFREHTGLSTSDYLVKIRMDKAKELMAENPDIMVKEVADLVGFKNQYHFSKTFKKLTGVWPTDFKG